MPSTTSSSVEALGLFHRDHALVADLLHRLGDHVTDLALAIGGDATDLGDLVRGRDLLGALLHVLDHSGNRQVDAALQVHRVHAGGNRLHALADQSLRQDRRGRGAVTGHVVGLRGHFAHHLGAHVLELVAELDLLGDGDAVLGDAGCAERLVDDDVAALRAQGHLHGVGQDVDAAQHTVARVAGKTYVFRWHGSFLQLNLCLTTTKKGRET